MDKASLIRALLSLITGSYLSHDKLISPKLYLLAFKSSQTTTVILPHHDVIDEGIPWPIQNRPGLSLLTAII